MPPSRHRRRRSRGSARRRARSTRSLPSRTSASTIGELRDPGDVHASRTPQRASSSTNARSSRWVSGPAGMMAGVSEPLLLLHGFTQTGRGWDEVARHLDGERYRPLAPDLRGHGAAGSRRPIDMDACVRDVAGLAARPLRARGLLDGRADRAARRARAPRARVAARARSRRRRASTTPPRAPRAARARRGARGLDRARTRSPSSPTAGARSRCSRASRRRSPRPRAPTGCATTSEHLAARCAGSARARWRRCGIASAS